jgi:uncharacterized protein involved in outer membrane biogenesis
MIRVFIGLIITLATALFLVLTALVIVPMVVDQDDYKEQIRSLVLEKSGHELILHEDISLSMNKFPQFTVVLGRSEIKNSSGFSSEDFVLVESIDVGVDLLSLFNGPPEVTYLSVSGLEINLEKNSAGVDNWSRAKAEKNSGEPEINQVVVAGDGSHRDDAKPQLAFLAGLSLGVINIESAEVSYIDQVKGISYSMEGLSIITSSFEPGEESEIAIKGHWLSENPASDGNINLKYKVLFDQSSWKLMVVDLILDVNSRRPGFLIKEGQVALKTDLVYNLKGGGVTLSNTDLDLKGWTDDLPFRELGVKFKGSAIASSGFATVHLPEDSVMTAQIKADTLPHAGIELAIHSDISFNRAASTLQMAKLRVKGPAGLLVSGELSGKSLKSQPELSGELSMERVDLEAMMIALGQHLSSTGVLSHGAIAAKFRVDAEGGELQNIRLQLDESNIEGVASISSFSRPVVAFDIKVDDLDLDHYLAAKKDGEVIPAEEGEVVVPVEAGAAIEMVSKTAEPSLFTGLANLDLYGKIVFDRLKLRKVVVSDLSIESTAQSGLITIAPVMANLYDGQLLANIAVDLRKPEPSIKFENSITGFQIGGLLNDLNGDAKFTGLTNLTYALNSKGADSLSLRKNLNGTISMAVDNGEVHGFDVVQKIRSIAKVGRDTRNGEASSDEPMVKATKFSELTATAIVKNGLIVNKDLKAVSPILHLTGKGSVDLVAEEVNYTLSADVYTAVKEVDLNKAKKLKGMVVPIHYWGPFSSIGVPKVENVDFSSLLKSSLKTKLLQDSIKKLGGEEKVKRELERLEKQFGGKLPVNKLLKGVLGF